MCMPVVAEILLSAFRANVLLRILTFVSFLYSPY